MDSLEAKYVLDPQAAKQVLLMVPNLYETPEKSTLVPLNSYGNVQFIITREDPCSLQHEYTIFDEEVVWTSMQHALTAEIIMIQNFISKEEAAKLLYKEVGTDTIHAALCACQILKQDTEFRRMWKKRRIARARKILRMCALQNVELMLSLLNPSIERFQYIWLPDTKDLWEQGDNNLVGTLLKETKFFLQKLATYIRKHMNGLIYSAQLMEQPTDNQPDTIPYEVEEFLWTQEQNMLVS